MKNLNNISLKTMSKIVALLAFAFLLCGLSAQPTEQMINNVQKQTTISDVPVDKLKIEAEYLDKARNNIEQYRKGDVKITIKDSSGKPLKDVSIEATQVSQDFLFGNIVWEFAYFRDKETYKPDEFKAKYKALFNYGIIPFYWESYEQQPGKPMWQGNEDAINWCLENGITMKGHPLAWTSPAGTPPWMLKLAPDMATDMLRARIYENIIGYKGKISIWDVVNEPVNTIPWEAALKDTSNRDHIRYNMLGVTVDQIVPWVEKAYKWAYEADPNGNYIINEFFTLALPGIRQRFYSLLKELQKRNVPFKGIGIQAHEPREMWFSPVEMYKTFDLYSEFNVPIHITELHPQSSGKQITGWRQGIWTEETQAEFAEQFYTLAFGHPSVKSITWWGLSDRNSWLPGGGLLDKEYNPKPAYTRLLKLIKEDWMTKNIVLKTDKTGNANFRGFFGDYSIKVTRRDGTSQVFKAHLSEDSDNSWTFTVQSTAK